MSLNSIFLSGISGRMGVEIKNLLEESSSSIKIGGGLSKDHIFGADSDCQITIDFSLPSALDKVIQICAKNQRPLLSGTTGYSEADFQKLKDLSALVPVFWSSNMSLGIFLFHKLIEVFGQTKKSKLELSLHEVHHTKKVDKPSGTALSLAKTASKCQLAIDEITSERTGEVPGIHIFTASGSSEVLKISHEAVSRSLFAEGALDISRWLIKQPSGFYGMKDYVADLN